MTDLLQRTVDELIEAGLVYKDGDKFKLTQRGIEIPLKELGAMFPPGGAKRAAKRGRKAKEKSNVHSEQDPAPSA